MINNFTRNLVVFLFLFNFFNVLYASNNYFQEGKRLFELKKYEDSKFKFEKDIVFNPKNEKSYLYLAKIFNKEKNIDLEESNLKTVILLNPKNEEALYLLALLSIKKSNFSKAKELIVIFEDVCDKLCLSKEELLKELKISSNK